jgi:hypothetical protein
VLWIDPGKMTGIALFHRPFGPDSSHEAVVNEFGFQDAGGHIASICQMYRDYLHIGWEDFTVRPHTPSIDAHHALEMIGVARWHAGRNGCKLLTPAKPGDRNVATQEMLNALGWWRPGLDDAQSAAQHLLAWLLRTGNLPAREAGILAALRH